MSNQNVVFLRIHAGFSLGFALSFSPVLGPDPDKHEESGPGGSSGLKLTNNQEPDGPDPPWSTQETSFKTPGLMSFVKPDRTLMLRRGNWSEGILNYLMKRGKLI